jgi:predicted alpha-1,2-mannosidase
MVNSLDTGDRGIAMAKMVRIGATHLISVVLVSVLTFAACGHDDSSVTSSDPTPPATPAPTPTPTPTAPLQLTQYVNPLIGTLGSNSLNPVPNGQAGSVVPAAGLPSGMVQWAPDTNTTRAPSTSKEPSSPAGYYYDIDTIQGFSLTHMSGAGCSGNDGEFPIMATTDATQLTPTFQHSNELAAPGYYSVQLDNQVKVELTATMRTGFGRFTYPTAQASILVINATRTNTRATTAGTVTQVTTSAISGSTTGGGFCGNSTAVPVYFYAEFDQPFTSGSVFSNGVATLAFNAGATVLMKIGISYVSIANAQLNLQQENAGWSFEAVQSAADATWNTLLNTIQVSGGDQDALTKFYTAFYHTLWAPSVFNDVNGQYLGFDQQVHTLATGQKAQYTSFSGWDIYRSLIALKATLFPSETSDMAQSLVNDADQCGALPHWVNDNVEVAVIPGDAGSLIVADAYAFGAQNFDVQGALSYMIKVSNIPGTTCQGTTEIGGLSTYLKYGYISGGESAEASSSLEYSSADFAVSGFAGALGNTTMQKILLSRSADWKNLLDTASTPVLIAARNPDGTWVSPLTVPTTTANYEEGNAEQYTWMVPYDAAGLFTQLGGNSAVVARLNTFFSSLNAGTTLPNFYMGNEPTFEVPWLYNWAGTPAATQNIVQQIMGTVFGTGPDGLPGNDDLGAVSGWYVWGALGLYPEVPGVGGFAIGSPQFPSIVVHLENGNTVQIVAPGAPASTYIGSLTVNGSEQTSSWLPFDSLKNGATLSYQMASQPSSWGTADADVPPSFAVPVATSVIDSYNNHGISVDGSVNMDGTGAALDGSLDSYSASAMAAAGLVPNQPFVFAGATFTLPDGTQALDNAIADGQTIQLPQGTVGSNLVILGSAHNGPSSGQAVLTYTDGTTTPFTLAFDDWTLNGGTATATGPVVATMTYRNESNGMKDNTANYLFAVEVPIAAGKTVASVSLPAQVSAGRIHVFGIGATP